MNGRDPDERHRVATPLELLFDLTFVVAFANVGNEMAHQVAAELIFLGRPGALPSRNRVVVPGYVVMRVAMLTQWLRAARQCPSRRGTCIAYAVSIAPRALAGWSPPSSTLP